jgi:hypothetical protein
MGVHAAAGTAGCEHAAAAAAWCAHAAAAAADGVMVIFRSSRLVRPKFRFLSRISKFWS